ncbi:YsnF/AvaK domain-containing protein [Siccirubricoccus sp. KC 17139]|uniref:YsnF/AvaK domain-containing protein n=1 Tax=Siccirubricoccus soli TaxID=2899147 RepID=A0ABT1CYX5_9PROT|nr:DUF2382 domain-containing protein [Siccirubricoccus soli]MCO6414862.1 YsnF/AvaK domain-containing protein [Siccirubricoccus soli]MCP2680992.1 YsnF/AvaK domain-containing protein [Siccirubricoccus soli]
MQEEPAETVIPILEERLKVTRATRATGRVRITLATATEERVVEEVLRQRRVEITRIPVNRPVPAPPPVREEGDTLVIPVLEEVLVVERRLMLREEVRLRLAHGERQEVKRIALRRQEPVIERLPPDPQQQERLMTRMITGLFDSRAEAERTVETLVQQHGIDRDRITVHAAGEENATAGTMERRDESHHGFLASLRDLFLPEEDRATYAEGLRRGGIMVSVRAEEAELEAVMDAFERHGAVDLDARESEWRAGGWTGEEAGTAPMSSYGGDAVLGPSSDGERTGMAAQPMPATPPMPAPQPAPAAGAAAAGGTTMPATGVSADRASDGGEVIPLVEERLRVGKREAQQGRVRVRSYVVETPVQEQVQLRQEHVEVERRPVDRPATAADAAAFTERSIEATETSEEAVVSKEARVREEVRLRKQVEERTETISDTVRHTEVKVEDDRAPTPAPGTAPRTTRDPER